MRNKIPEQITRLSIIIVALIAFLLVARSVLVPPDFGKYGNYRASAVDEIVKQEVKYAGQEICGECHVDIVAVKKVGYHRNVSCEVCHGPAALHAAGLDTVGLIIPGGRGYCVLCHEYLNSRPTGFPQIVSESHNPMKLCESCHNPHDPRPPETPKECVACHATIARTKSISHHTNVSCVRCHETPKQHQINPRDFLPSKPSTREFCGGCHGKDARTLETTRKVDINTHGGRYVCWQCHYPHMPEGQQ